MKKYFMFVAVAAAGMLASCSSESLTAGSDPKIEPTQDDRVPIEIGVASAQTKASTRGTGTAGDLATGTNIWNGERINVLMYEIDPSGNPTFNPTQDANGFNLYDENISLVTPLTDENTATGIAKEPTNPATIGAGQTYKVKYYPATGRLISGAIILVVLVILLLLLLLLLMTLQAMVLLPCMKMLLLQHLR